MLVGGRQINVTTFLRGAFSLFFLVEGGQKEHNNSILGIAFDLFLALSHTLLQGGGQGGLPLTNFGSMITREFSSHTKSRFASVVLDGPWRPSWQTQQ